MITLGDFYRIKMDNDDGITPQGNDTYRYKYIIIIANNNNILYGAVVTNTKDHPLIPIEFQYPLNHNGHKCFVNCHKLYEVSPERLTQDCYQGNIADTDHYKYIVECVKTSPLLPKKKLKQFGLLENENN